MIKKNASLVLIQQIENDSKTHLTNTCNQCNYYKLQTKTK